MHQKQVEIDHYKFKKYVHKKRWISMWHQIDEVLSLAPLSILEIGPGPGIFKAIIRHFGISIESVDLDPDLGPDFVASAVDLPIDHNVYDCVCAFQMLEHLPYEQSLQAFGEMVRVTKDYIVISLPDAEKKWVYSLDVPIWGEIIFHLPRPWLRKQIHNFNGEHCWEINKRGFLLHKVIDDFSRKNVILLKTYRVDTYPYHRFFIYKKV